ncbi:hypothetical protein STEG23_021280 [Scotinomys teguina]
MATLLSVKPNGCWRLAQSLVQALLVTRKPVGSGFLCIWSPGLVPPPPPGQALGRRLAAWGQSPLPPTPCGEWSAPGPAEAAAGESASLERASAGHSIPNNSPSLLDVTGNQEGHTSGNSAKITGN